MFPKPPRPPDIGVNRPRSQKPVRVETFPRHETYLQQPPAFAIWEDNIRPWRMSTRPNEEAFSALRIKEPLGLSMQRGFPLGDRLRRISLLFPVGRYGPSPRLSNRPILVALMYREHLVASDD